MESVLKTYKVVRNNWKKSVFGTICVFYGGKFLVNKYRENLYMREVCREAKAYGDMPLPNESRPRHVTVILNPAANDGKCRAQFDKYCGPLLNLAGLKVGIIKTEKEGQAKDLMELMDNTDAVVIAGGDGTAAEAVTGLLRRTDRAAAARRLPLALLPLGRTNGSALTLLSGWEAADTARRVTQATLALIRDTVLPLDVMEVQAVETEAELPGRPVYLLSDVWWGAHRDVHAKTHAYWYWGALKHRAAYLLNVFRGLTWECAAEMEYTVYCGGCSRCYQRQQQEEAAPEPHDTPTRWWARLLPRPKPTPRPITEPVEDVSAVENPQCGVWHTESCSGVEWRLRPSHASHDKLPGLHLSLGPEGVTAAEFVREGWRRVRGEPEESARHLVVGEVRLTPAPQLWSAAGRLSARSDDSGATREGAATGEQYLTPDTTVPVPETAESSVSGMSAADTPLPAPEQTTALMEKPTTETEKPEAETIANSRWFGFDSEEFEVRPVHIRLLPKAVRVFASGAASS